MPFLQKLGWSPGSKRPPPIGTSQWRFGGESPWWIHIWRQVGWSLMTDVYILFVRPKRCVFADLLWVFEDFSIMIHDDLWFQEFCMTLWNVWKIRWNIDTTGPKRCCISRKTAGFFEGILLILDVQITFQNMLFKTATFQTRHFLIGEIVHVVPETATLEMHFNSFYTTSHISNQTFPKHITCLPEPGFLQGMLHCTLESNNITSLQNVVHFRSDLLLLSNEYCLVCNRSSCIPQLQLMHVLQGVLHLQKALYNIKYILLPFPGVLPFQGNATLSKK